MGSFSDPEDVPGLAHLLEHSEPTAAHMGCFCMLLSLASFLLELEGAGREGGRGEGRGGEGRGGEGRGNEAYSLCDF